MCDLEMALQDRKRKDSFDLLLLCFSDTTMSRLWRTEAIAKNIVHIPNITLIGNALTWNTQWSQKIFWRYDRHNNNQRCLY